MRVSRLQLRDFRNYERAELPIGETLTVVCGPNGAGKTNLLEALYFGCVGRSCRTSNEREVVRRGAELTRVVVETSADGRSHLLEAGFKAGEPKRFRVDGAPVEQLASGEIPRPLVAVFMPERLELVKGPPAARRAHVDRLVASLWPARAATRAAYSRALAQRNALIARVRAGQAATDALAPWDRALARHGADLAADRGEAIELLAEPFSRRAAELGLPGAAELRYRPRSQAPGAEGLAAELAERRAADVERGFTAHGPHRDELQLVLGGESLRAYGSQGQQRTALLALLFAERDTLLERRGVAPLMLLDDVMSELDGARRERLSALLCDTGQAVVTATEAAQVPGAAREGTARVEVEAGSARWLAFPVLAA